MFYSVTPNILFCTYVFSVTSKCTVQNTTGFLYTNPRQQLCSEQSWILSWVLPRWRGRQGAHWERGYTASQSSSHWWRPAHGLQSPKSPKPDKIWKLSERGKNKIYIRACWHFSNYNHSNLSWVFSMEIPSWNSLTPFSKHHLLF